MNTTLTSHDIPFFNVGDIVSVNGIRYKVIKIKTNTINLRQWRWYDKVIYWFRMLWWRVKCQNKDT